MVIFVVVAIILEFVARSAVAIVVVVVVVTRRHRRRHRIISRHHPSRHGHQPSPAAVLSITFATPIDGWLLRSPPAPRSLSR